VIRAGGARIAYHAGNLETLECARTRPTSAPLDSRSFYLPHSMGFNFPGMWGEIKKASGNITMKKRAMKKKAS